MSRTQTDGPEGRDRYRWFTRLETRWADNDVYGHINNAAYYGFFDTAVNRRLIDAGLLDIERGETIALVVETGCRYFAPVAFPDAVEVGLRVDRLGGSSVIYGTALFVEGAPTCAAAGRFVHVFVDRTTRRPVPIPDPVRASLESLRLD